MKWSKIRWNICTINIFLAIFPESCVDMISSYLALLVLYKHSLVLHRLYNVHEPRTEWCNLNFQHQFSTRQTNFKVARSNKLSIGKNIIVNRLSILNNKIQMDWLNLSYTQFKVKVTNIFLTYDWTGAEDWNWEAN